MDPRYFLLLQEGSLFPWTRSNLQHGTPDAAETLDTVMTADLNTDDVIFAHKLAGIISPLSV